MEPNETSAGAPSEQNDATMQNDSNMTAEMPSVDAVVGAEAIVASEEIAESAKMPKNDASGAMMDGGAKPKKNGKGMLIGMILFALLAAGGIGFGVWVMMDGNSQAADADKQLATANQQVDELKKQNEELQDELDEARREEGIEKSEGNIVGENDSGTVNPVIKPYDSEKEYHITFRSSSIGSSEKGFEIEYRNGAVEKCSVGLYKEVSGGGWSFEKEDCNVIGLSGEIYRIIRFGAGHDGSSDNIGFLMTDGSVWYAPLMESAESGKIEVKPLRIDGKVVDAVGVNVFEQHAHGGYGSTIFIMDDGSIAQYEETML